MTLVAKAREQTFESTNSGGNTFIEFMVLQDTSFPAIRPVVTADITSEMTSGEFIQIAGTIDVVSGTVELFVNGVSVGSGANASLNDWSDGAEGSGLAQRDGTMYIQNGPNFDSFEGEIAIFRFYETALEASQISQNYDAITATGGGALTVVSFDSTSVSGANVVVGSDGSISYDSGVSFCIFERWRVVRRHFYLYRSKTHRQIPTRRRSQLR